MIHIDSAPDFETLVLAILEDGGKRHFNLPFSVIPLFRNDESAGFAYFEKTRLIYRLEIRKSIPTRIEFDWIDAGTGAILERRAFQTGGIGGGNPPANLRRFEPACPVTDLLYRIAFNEFERVTAENADLHLIRLLERTLDSIGRSKPGLLGFKRGRDPGAWSRLQENLDRLAISRVHTWKERLLLAKRMKSDYRRMIRFKQRIHRSRSLTSRILEGWLSWMRAMQRFVKRPRDNLIGISDHLLLDPIRWFGGVVRSNMGYSIALAVYSPFTFFFITQPMNPHAMWAVEKVRNAGLGIMETGFPAHRTGHPPRPLPESDGEAAWRRRMDQFKSMQIALESNLDFSKRIGRLEEIETQLAWPITLEGAWDEATRYGSSLDYLAGSAVDPRFRGLVMAERRRLGEIRNYLRDRLLRFILDHRYLILDPGSELGQSGNPSRRAVTLYSRIHEVLLKEYPNQPAPPEAEAIIAVAARNPATDTTDRIFNREERARYWESLYLMQNRNQESSNAGMQAYWWSVRNTVSVIQMMLATRREEIVLLSLHPRPPSRERASFEERYRSMLNLLENEFHSIRPELSSTLPGDRETSFREGLLAGIRDYLRERERL